MTWSDEAAANTASLAKCASQMYVSASAASTAVMFRLPTTVQQQHRHPLNHPTHLTFLCSFSHAGLCVKYPCSISTIANKDFSTNSHSTTRRLKHLMNFESVKTFEVRALWNSNSNFVTSLISVSLTVCTTHSYFWSVTVITVLRTVHIQLHSTVLL